MRRAARTPPAQQPQKQRLGLVVAMLREDHEIDARKNPGAGRPSQRPQAEIAVRTDVHRLDLQGNLDAGAQLAAETGPARGIRADAVIDVHRAQRKSHVPRESRQNGQERNRIHAPRETQHQMSARGNRRRNRRRYPFGQFT
jgi:hypothetical protein